MAKLLNNSSPIWSYVAPHLESFNSIFDDELLEAIVLDIPKRSIKRDKQKLTIWVENLHIGKPLLKDKESFSLERKIYPSECRQRGITYDGELTSTICWQIDSGEVKSVDVSFGRIPIMVGSKKCHLYHLSGDEKRKKGEEYHENGGYFIVNGQERLIRLLQVTRRSYPISLKKVIYTKKGTGMTEYAVCIRSSRQDQSTQTIYLHYTRDGSCIIRFILYKREYLVPLSLFIRALGTFTEKTIYDALSDSNDNPKVRCMVDIFIENLHKVKLNTNQALEFLGKRFKVILNHDEFATDLEIGHYLISKYFLVHLDKYNDKLSLLLHMLRKLFFHIADISGEDNQDVLSSHEILMPGHLYLSILKEKIDDAMSSIIRTLKKFESSENSVESVESCIHKSPIDVGQKLNYFLGTGNLSARSSMDLMQVTGFTIIAERLNYMRYISHFRSVHRGAFFATLKTTTVRKLFPESWGFLCPVHTPDGSPCGLLNHLSRDAYIVSSSRECENGRKAVTTVLSNVDIPFPIHPLVKVSDGPIPVIVDGKIILRVSKNDAEKIYRSLLTQRYLSKALEIAYIPKVIKHSTNVGLYIFTDYSRIMRPVFHKSHMKTGYIGTLEQVYLDIEVQNNEFQNSPYKELDMTSILSVVAGITPFSDFNQSPRNMYQCQMGKQSMGTPLYTWKYRADNKLYQLQTPQFPLVKPKLYDFVGISDYPCGVNAIVAVISYTGYDMEDASVINRSSVDRGYMNASIYKTEIIELWASSPRRLKTPCCSDRLILSNNYLDGDGLPHVGKLIHPGEPLISIYDPHLKKEEITYLKGTDPVYIDGIAIIGGDSGTEPPQKINIRFRTPRNPVIGDKVSSRHGQKGVFSQQWMSIDMPFTESGIVPDLIINPHAFPSRMTIGMFVESMAGKVSAISGKPQDATPFKMNERFTDKPPHVYFGEQLIEKGYNYYGSEPLYSGITGELFDIDIYIGVVYYQRLRHMVGDKFQVRSTGPVHNLTRQPIKGRKRAGGIRFGEMERDALIAHGTAMCLQDRLMNCSDYTLMMLCIKCGNLFSLKPVSKGSSKYICSICETSANLKTVSLPYVFKYLAAELTAMNIHVKLSVL